MAIAVTLVALTVGAVVAIAAAVSGTGTCAAPGLDPSSPVPPVDSACVHLVRSLAERAGLITAGFTAIMALTVVGLSRLGGADRLARAERMWEEGVGGAATGGIGDD